MTEESCLDVEYILVPRTPEGDVSEFGKGILSAVAPGGFSFDFDAQSAPSIEEPHGEIVAELAKLLLVSRVNLPSPNPFLIVKRSLDGSASEPTATFHCGCGNAATCSGSGT